MPSSQPLSHRDLKVRLREHLERTSASERTATWALVLTIALYVVITAIASGRHLWHDELYTFYIATAPSWQRFWQELPLDLNPPLEYLSVRASTALFGNGGYAIRLPSIVAFLAGSLCLYRFVANRLTGRYGLLGMLVFWASPFFYYATEARPYAIAIGCLGLTLLCWGRATRAQRSRADLVLLVLSVTGMMLSHLMALFYITPFCLAELVRSHRRRKLDVAIWAALLVPCAIPVLFLRLTARFASTVFPPVFQASLHKIPETYYGSLKVEALPLLLALCLAWLAIPKSDDRGNGWRMDAVDAALTAGFLAIPALVNLVLLRTHGAYFDRYAFPVAFGYALTSVWFLASRAPRNVLAPMAASSVLLLFVCGFNLGPGLKQSVWTHRGAAEKANEKRLDQVEPNLPLVAASGLTFLEIDRYEDARTVERLYYLTDRALAIRYASATIFEGMPDLKAYFPIRAHVESYSEFVAAHPTFLVLGTPEYPEDWLLRALADMHAVVDYAGEFPGPYKDKQLYRVTINIAR